MADIYVNDFNKQKPQNAQAQDPALEGVDLSKPLTGEEVAEAIKLRTAGQLDWNPTHEDFLAYNEWNKNRHIDVMDGLIEGSAAVLGDLGNAVGQVFTHPIDSTFKFAPSVVEAFMQGSRNLYGMVAQSQDPDSVLFKWKNALSHDGSADGYNQFLDALDFNKRSTELASGKDTILINKDYIDHDITLAASYIADPTLFIPFGTVASAGLKAAGLGERVAMIGARVEAMKGALIGGGLKMAGGAIEAVGGATRATMDGALKVGGNVLETATGMSSREWQATARMSGMTGSFANMMGADIAGVSGLSGAYVASGAARGVGEAMGAVGEQMLKQGGKRGFNSFAVEALKNTPNLSPHAQKLLKVLDSVDPMLSYANTIGTGMAHGAVIGGGLGYLSAGEEGMAHGMGAGIALGGVGAGLGRMYADYTGGTMYQRAEVQGTFVMENWKKTSPEKHAFGQKLLDDATAKGDRAGALQIIAGLDKIAPDARFFAGKSADIQAFLKSKGIDVKGFKVDPETGARVKDSNGKDIKISENIEGIEGAEGVVFTVHSEKVNGKKQTTLLLNTEHSLNTTYHHELFHAIFRETVMKDFFKDKLSSKLLGEYENGVKVKNGEIHPKEFRAFAERYNSALHKTDKEAYNASMKQFDNALAEWERAKKLGKDAVMGADGNTQAGEAAKHLEDMVEEFGAYYFTQMMKGKPLDYLFRGADLGGVRGAFESIHNSFLDFFEGRARKANPEGAGKFDFSKTLDKAFVKEGNTEFGRTGEGVGVTGTSTKRVRVGGIDYLMRDLIRATASQSKGSVGGVDVRTWTPEARTAFFEGRGADGLKFQFDKNGNRLPKEEIERLSKEHGKAVFDALSTLDPNLVKDGVITGTLSEAHIKHLVDKGLISPELGNRIKNIQRMVNDPSVSNVITHDYHGNTKELEGDVNNPKRLRGNEVPITHRESIVFGYRFSVDKEGKTVMIAEALDKQVLDFRGNKEWAKPEVRQLFGDNRDAFDKAFIEYIKNANKDASDPTRVESAKLPLLEVGDGLGKKRRDIMHQVAGFAKAKGVDYINPPLSEIKRNTRSTRQSLRVDLMSDVKTQSTTRFEFNDTNAFSDLSRNFKPSEMDAETTPNGTVYKHPNNSSIMKATDGSYSVYDSRNKLIGKYRTEAEASRSLEYNFNKEEQRIQRNIETGIKTQQKVQGSFKVIDVATRKEAERTGNIFTTQWGKEFTAGTKVVPQTREEFMASNMIKLRQAKPEVIRQFVEAKVAEVQGMRQRIEQIKLEFKAEWNRAGMETTKTKALQKEASFLQARASKYDILENAVNADKAKGGKGTHILEVINNLRENGGSYKDISRMLFGDVYDKQFKTGEPVTTVATHGTTSEALLKSMEFDINRLGETHGSEKDKVGAFLSGSTTTSQQYSYGKENIGMKSQPMRQVRALVKMENPYVVDLNYKAYDARLYDNHFKLAKEGGHDGIIFNNVYDGGGAADSVFIPFAEKLAQNTAILDTVKTDVGTFDDKGYSPAQRPLTGRGTTTLSDLVKGSFKVSEIVRETGFDKLLENAKISGRLIKGAESANFSGRPVVIINYDNTGVWKFTDSVTGESLGELHGGAMHNLISGEINPDKQSAILASVNKAGLKRIEEVRLKADKNGTPLTFLIVSGKETKSLSNPQIGQTVTKFVSRMLHNKALSPSDLNQLIIAMSEARKKNSEGVWIPMGDKLKGIIGKSPAEQISFLENKFFPQELSTFNERGSTLDRLIQQLGELDSVRKSPDFYRNFFGDKQMKMTGKGFKEAILKLTDDPITRDAQGNSIGYGMIVAALEVPNTNKIVDVKGGHTGFPVDYRSKKGVDTYEPATMSIFETPRRIVDMLNRPSNKDIGTHYKTDSGEVRPTSEMIMNTTSTFGEGVVREGKHEVRPDTHPEKMLSKEDIKGKYKPAEYTDTQVNNEFIGKFAEENPDIASKYLIRLKSSESDEGEGYKIVIYDKETRKPVARSKWEIIEDYDKRGEPYIKEAGADVEILDDSYKGKKLSHLMQSERLERSRHFGAIKTMSQITNQEGIPIKNYAKTIGEEKGRIADDSIETDGEEIPTIPATMENFNRVMNNAKSKQDNVWKPTVFYEGDINPNGRYKVSEGVKKGVSDIDTTIAGISKRSVVSSGILSALDDFKEALRKQDATDEIVVKEVEETHTALLNAINDEMGASSEASLPDLRTIKKKVESIDRGLKKNQGRIGEKVKKNYQSEMDEGADIESQQAIRAKNEVESDLETGADIESEQAFDRTQERVAQQEADMSEGADIEGEQAFDAREQASAEAERQSNAQAQAQTQAENAQAQSQPQPTPQPKVTNERDSWRLYATERTPNGSISKNAKGFSIILNGTKLRVYNPQNVLLGIYTDLEQAKRRVQREEPKPR